MQVRDATIADAEAFGLVHVRAWQRAYRGGLMPDEYLDGLSAEDRARMWIETLSEPSPTMVYLVAEDDRGVVVGFIVAGPADENGEQSDGEVYALNVDPTMWGRGVGSALLDAGTVALRQRGFRRSVLWVHPDNTRARRFYEREGWSRDGRTRDADVLGVRVPEARYSTSL